MAPEMHAGRQYGAPADLWSLGCLLFELCSLRPLFAERDEEVLARKVRDQGLDVSRRGDRPLCSPLPLPPRPLRWARCAFLCWLPVCFPSPGPSCASAGQARAPAFKRPYLVPFAALHSTPPPPHPPPPSRIAPSQVLSMSLPPAIPARYSPELQVGGWGWAVMCSCVCVRVCVRACVWCWRVGGWGEGDRERGSALKQYWQGCRRLVQRLEAYPQRGDVGRDGGPRMQKNTQSWQARLLQLLPPTLRPRRS
jgi:hypothetical protein